MNDSGINFDRLDSLVLSLYDSLERINKILYSADEIIDNTKNVYMSETSSNLVNKFNSYKSNYKILNDNILTIAADLMTVKKNYQNSDISLAKKLNNVVDVKYVENKEVEL